MSRAVALTFALLVAGGVAFAVEVDGFPVKLKAPLPLGGDAVDVAFKAYTASVGVKDAVILSGHAVSHLPHECFRVVVTLRFYDVYADRKDIFDPACLQLEFKGMPPERPVRWRKILRSAHDEKGFGWFARRKPVHTVQIHFEKFVPGAGEN